MPLTTIILTTLNSEQFVARSIESCLLQTHRDLELLVVDGGSQDRTLEILAGYDDPRIRLIHQENNTGRLPGAINLGMANARGDFITWTQGDCWYEPHAIQTMYALLCDHPEVALVYADYWDVDLTGKRERYQTVPPPEDMFKGDAFRVCFLFRREVYDTLGPQNTRYFPVHEVPWRMRIVQNFSVQPLHIPLMYYTVHPNSLTGRIGGWELQRMTAANLFQEGYLDRRTYRRRQAEIDINQAYAEFVLQGNYCMFWRHVIAGAYRDMHWLRDRGLWKLMIISLFPNRDRLQRKLHAVWKAKDLMAQQSLVDRAHQSLEVSSPVHCAPEDSGS